MPMGISPTEMQNLIQFLGGSASTPYGAKRAALGQVAPWTTVFPTIHLELGDEAWNTAFSGDTIESPYAYGSRISTIFGAARSASGYDPTKFDLIMDGWSDVPWWNQTAMNNAKNTYDTIDIAPYTFNTFTDYSSNEAIFGSMLAQPESMDSRSTGTVYQQAQAVSGQAGGLTGKPANLAVYEVNLSTTAGTAPQSVLSQVVPSLGAGLSVAEHMLLMMRDDNVALQTMFCLPGYINGFANSNGGGADVQIWGTVIDMGGPTNLSRPQLLAEQLANTAIGGTMLATVQTGTNPTWNENSKNDPSHPIVINGAHYLQSFAFANGTSNSLILFNLSRTASLPVTFSGVNAPTGTVQQGLLTSSAITNSNENTGQVAIANSTIQNFNPSAITTLPPYSMTVYQWSTAGGSQPTQPIATTTSLAVTPASITVGQSVAMTATVAQSSGTTVPTGSVLLSDNGTTIGTATLTNGQLSLNSTTLALGTHAITASYQGSSAFAASVSPAATVTVTAAPLVSTSTAIIAPTQVVAGQSTSLAATVTPVSGSAPTGTTTFFVGSTNLGAVSLNGGKATLAIPAVTMPAGTYSVVANYSGSTIDSPSTSTAATLVVSAPVVATTTTVTAPAQVTDGNSASFTATVAAASGTTPTGSVTFSAGSTVLGTGTLTAGKATLTIPSITLTAGSYAVTASYAGTTANSASTSTAINMTVSAPVVATTTTVTAPAQVTDGNSASFTATVAAASGTTPTGSVTFSAGSTVLGTGTLTAGKATLTIPSITLTAGSYAVTASYAGTTANSASTSTAINMTVSAPVVATTTTVMAPAQVTDGNSASFTATVAAASGTTPTGSVTFSAGSTVLGTGTLTAGKATLTIPSITLTAGSYAVTASYAGTAANSASTSAAVNMTVAGAVVATTTTVTAPAQVTDGNSASFTATVAAASGTTPTGSVTFSAGSTVLGTGTLTAGKATLTIPSITLTAGSYAVTASYAGTAANSASTSAAVNMMVSAPVVATTTTVTAPAQVTDGNSATFTATVAAASGTTPTGSVTFSAGSTVLGTGTLIASKATLTIPSITLTAGSYAVTASYAGTTTNSASTSAAVNMTVAGAVVATTTTVTAPAQVTDGNSASFTATVAAVSGTTPTGSVTFSAGSTVLGTGTLIAGKTTLTIPSITLTAGSYAVTASYAGTTANSASTSAAVNMTVAGAVVNTTTTMTVSSTNLTIGQTVNATITVAAASGATPTGTVNIYLGTTLIDTTTLSNGIATFSTTVTGSTGTFTAYAAYKGSPSDRASRSATTTITISAAAVSTATTLNSNTAQATQGSPVTLSASVAPHQKGATATGAVAFFLGSTSLGTAQLVNGTASLTFNAQFTPGQYQLSAVYQGNATDLASTSNAIAFTVTSNVLATTTQLSSTATQLTTGQTTVLTSTVIASHNGSTPTGTVSFFLGGNKLGTAVLNNGIATYTFNASMTAGTYQLSAVYAGTAQDSTSSSAPLSITIAPSVVATTTSLTISASEIAPGQPFTMNVVVAPKTGNAIPQGTVTFYLGQTSVGTATLTGGKATFAVSNSFASGAYQLTAVYGGNTSGGQQDSSSTSAPVPLTISTSLVATSTSLLSSASQVTAGQSLSLTAVVSPRSGSVVPQGSVNFYLGQTQIGSATLTGGKATLSVAGTQTSVAGTYPVIAVYAGNTMNGGSSSNPVTVTIASNIAATTTLLSATASQIAVNQPISLNVIVSASTGSPTPQGLVSFYLGQTELGTANLAGGRASLSAANSLAPGTYPVIAVYAGNSQDSGSTSSPLMLSVTAPASLPPVATTTVLTLADAQVTQGQPFALTAVVEPRSGSMTPLGTVNFFLAQTQIGSATLAAGTATLTQAVNLAPGTYALTAVYAGDAQNSGSTSSSVTLTIASSTASVPPAAQALPTTLALTVNPQEPTAGQPMNFQVQVAAVGSTTPVSGSVTLYLGQTSLGTLTLTGGTGMVTMAAPQAGTYSVSAVFTQQGDYLASETQPVSFTVEAPTAVQPIAPAAPTGTFTLGLSSSEVTLGNAQSATLQVMVAPMQGYIGTVQLSCDGLPDGIACNFAPANLAVKAGNASSTLSLSAPVNTASSYPMLSKVAQCMLLPWDIIGILGFIFGRKQLRGHWSLFAMLCLALLGSTAFMTGCGLTVNTVTRPYQVQVTAVGTNQVSQTTTLTLNVTQPAAQF